jgi:hypothetical protein
MSQLNLGLRFGFVFVPARSFQHLLTIDLQRRSLEAIHRHLEPTGQVVLHLFDPRLDLLIDSNSIRPVLSGTHPPTESRSLDRKLKPLPPDPFRHQDSAIARGSISRVGTLPASPA